MGFNSGFKGLIAMRT